MPTIFDNLKITLATGLDNYLVNVNRLDCSVGYFNLRGWKEIANQVDALFGGKIS